MGIIDGVLAVMLAIVAAICVDLVKRKSNQPIELTKSRSRGFKISVELELK